LSRKQFPVRFVRAADPSFRSCALYVHATLGLNAHRSVFTQGMGYYEAFWILEEPLDREEVTKWLTYG